MKQTLSSRAMKRLVIAVIAVFAFICCLSLPSLERSASAQDKKDKLDPSNPLAPAGTPPFVTLTDGNVTVVVNSFGRSGNFSVGTDDVLFIHTDFISIAGGPVEPIFPGNPRCTVVSEIMQDTPSHATSAVQCGDAIIFFDHTVDGATGTWTTVVTVTGVTSACYYPYTDYDVIDFPNNGGSWHAGEGGGLGRFVVRNNAIMPDIHYLFTDASGSMDMGGAVHWEQDEFPLLANKISGFMACEDLADAPPLFNGDWTGALHYNFPKIDPKAGVTLTYSHSRDDSVPFEVVPPNRAPDLVPTGLRQFGITNRLGGPTLEFGILTANIGAQDYVRPRNPDNPAQWLLLQIYEYALYHEVDGEFVEIDRRRKNTICTIDSLRPPEFACLVEHGFRFTCSQITGNQGVSRGYADDYSRGLTGQWVFVGDNRGRFRLEAILDPDSDLQRTDIPEAARDGNPRNNFANVFFTWDGVALQDIEIVLSFDPASICPAP